MDLQGLQTQASQQVQYSARLERLEAALADVKVAQGTLKCIVERMERASAGDEMTAVATDTTFAAACVAPLRGDLGIAPVKQVLPGVQALYTFLATSLSKSS